MNNKIGLIGLGAMGKALADKLLEHDVPLSVWNRSADKTHAFENSQASIAASADELFIGSEAIIFMLTDADAINSVLASLNTSLAGKTVIQMGTITPSDSVALADKIQDLQGVYFEAPVLGSIPDIKAEKLIVMVGGSEQNLQDWRWLFNTFAPNPMLIGKIGDAATLKLAMNQLIGSLTCAFSSSLSLIMNKGINLDTFMQVVRDSALYAPTYDKKLDKMLNLDFKNGNFSTKHLLKDLNFFIDEANTCDVDTTMVESVRDITQATVEAGQADDDYSALYSVINKKS